MVLPTGLTLYDLDGFRGRRMRRRRVSATDFIGPLGVIFDAGGHESSDALLMRRWKEGPHQKGSKRAPKGPGLCISLGIIRLCIQRVYAADFVEK